MPTDSETAKTPPPTLQGMVTTAEDRRALTAALEQAFDYRGDVTLTLNSGEGVTGYIFDRRTAESLEASTVRLLPAAGGPKITVRYSDIARLEFTGKDAAHGKTFENWIKRYAEARTKGQKASIESESLD